MTKELLNEFTIGTFAKLAGVSVETIRFYQRKKLIVLPVKPYGGTRKYGLADVRRLKFIKSAQGLGFSLQEVEQLLVLDEGTHCSEVMHIAEEKLIHIRQKLQELNKMEQLLSKFTQDCDVNQNKQRGTHQVCPLIDQLMH